MDIVVRTRGTGVGAIRRRAPIHELDAELPLSNVRSMEDTFQ